MPLFSRNYYKNIFINIPIFQELRKRGIKLGEGGRNFFQKLTSGRDDYSVLESTH